MTEQQLGTKECPFCASDIKAHATVCPHCGARRIIGLNAKGRPITKAGVYLTRVVAVVLPLAGLALFQTEPIPGGVTLALWLLILFFNRSVIFPSKDKGEQWFRPN